MILAVSSSSTVVSVAFLSEEGDVLFEARRSAAMAASGACVELIETGLAKLHIGLKDVALFVADVGPGSFIGVRVCVTLVKTLVFANGGQAAGVTAFDLISAGETVAVPSKKGEYFVREAGKDPVRIPASEMVGRQATVGYGPDFPDPTYPNAALVASLLKSLIPMPPEALLPQYLIEPSISTPKKAFVSRPE